MKTAQVVITESGKTVMDPNKGIVVHGVLRRAFVTEGGDGLIEVLIDARDDEKAFTKTELVEVLGYTAKELRAAATTIGKKERTAAAAAAAKKDKK